MVQGGSGGDWDDNGVIVVAVICSRQSLVVMERSLQNLVAVGRRASRRDGGMLTRFHCVNV